MTDAVHHKANEQNIRRQHWKGEWMEPKGKLSRFNPKHWRHRSSPQQMFTVHVYIHLIVALCDLKKIFFICIVSKQVFICLSNQIKSSRGRKHTSPLFGFPSHFSTHPACLAGVKKTLPWWGNEVGVCRLSAFGAIFVPGAGHTYLTEL